VSAGDEQEYKGLWNALNRVAAAMKEHCFNCQFTPQTQKLQQRFHILERFFMELNLP
jgi:hypothetical protein